MDTSIEAFSLLVIRSSDIDRAAEFYAKLGLILKVEKHGSGPRHFAAEIGKTVLEIYPLGNRQPTTDIRLGFLVTSLNAVLEYVGSTTEIVVTEYGYQAVVHDPDGHTIELTEKQTPDQG